MMAYPGSIPSILILLKLLGLFYQKTLPLSNGPAGFACVRTMIRRIIEKSAEPGPGAWCLTALQPLFLRREAPRPAPHFPDRVRGRGASSLANPCSFVGKHHVRLPFSRPGPGAWCLTALQPLFLRRGAPRPAPHFPDRVRGRGASSLASPYSFVRRHHVRRLKHSAGFACGRILQNLDYSR